MFKLTCPDIITQGLLLLNKINYLNEKKQIFARKYFIFLIMTNNVTKQE
jgi:hypothetical protein